MAGGPTIGAGERAPTVWAARPAMAWAVRIATVLVPFLAAIGVAVLVGPVLLRPTGAWGAALWVVQISVLSTVAVLVVDRLARRTLPLASLYNLSLVFPDEAPSRFRTALKSGSVRRLQDAMAARPVDESASASATRLLAMVAELNDHDRLTRGHTERVRAYSDLIAEQMGLPEDDRWKLRWAVLLHDIGKLTVPPEILNKKGRPTDEEWAILSGHPAAGAVMVEPLADWLGEWRLSTVQHHERWDGTGYPNGLAGEQISPAGRIVAVADAYDVITSARSYKKPMTAQVAREELVRCAGSQFDPQVVRAFVNVSLGRLRLAGGPMAWLASLPRLGSLPEVAAGVLGNVVAVISAAALVFSVGLASPPHRQSPRVVTAPAAATGGHRSGSTTTIPVTSTTTTTSAGGGSGGGGASPTGPAGDGDGGGSAGTTTTGGVVTTTTGGPEPSTTSGDGRPTPTTSTTGGRPASTTSSAPQATTTTPAGPTATTGVMVGPVAVADDETAVGGVRTDLAVLANDSPGSAPLDASSVTITTAPHHASAVLVTGTGAIAYTAQSGFTGTDSLSYRVCNDNGLCASATATIAVT